jgi:hypothetical protein
MSSRLDVKDVWFLRLGVLSHNIIQYLENVKSKPYGAVLSLTKKVSYLQ